MTHTYIRSPENSALWQVGYWRTNGFRVMREFTVESLAAAFANYLNGGIGDPMAATRLFEHRGAVQ